MRRKINNKEYAIRLNTKFGDYYFSRFSFSSKIYNTKQFFFTQDLKKVQKWKTFKYAENYANEIISEQKRHQIVLLFENIDNINDIDKKDFLCVRKKYYYKVKNIISAINLANAKSNLEMLDNTLITDTENILNMIKENRQTEKDFLLIFKKLESDINLYRKDFSLLDKYSKSNIDAKIDIVDASYGFRLLKLKNLNSIQNENN